MATNFQKRNLEGQKGQGLVEYIALTALVAVVSLSAVKFLGSKVKTHIQGTANRFDRTIRSGLTARGSASGAGASVEHDDEGPEAGAPRPRSRGRHSVFDILNSF